MPFVFSDKIFTWTCCTNLNLHHEWQSKHPLIHEHSHTLQWQHNATSKCATRPPFWCSVALYLTTHDPSQLVNSPVFFFRCPMCSRWIGNCISALLVCVCECKAAVLYLIKLIKWCALTCLIQSVLTLWAVEKKINYTTSGEEVNCLFGTTNM